MTVAELLTVLIHADQSKEVWIKDPDPEAILLFEPLSCSVEKDGDIVISIRDEY